MGIECPLIEIFIIHISILPRIQIPRFLIDSNYMVENLQEHLMAALDCIVISKSIFLKNSMSIYLTMQLKLDVLTSHSMCQIVSVMLVVTLKNIILINVQNVEVRKQRIELELLDISDLLKSLIKNDTKKL